MTVAVIDTHGKSLTDHTVTWESSNEVAATVSPTGLVRGTGEASSIIITATYDGVSGSAEIKSLIDLRAHWQGTANGLTHRFTIASNNFCPQPACANAGSGGWNALGSGAAYTVGYGYRQFGAISFDLYNAADHFHFQGSYTDGTTMTGTIDGVPVVFNRT